MPDDPRSTAFQILNRVREKRLPLDRVLEQVSVQDLSKRDRALANAIVYGVLRWQARLDWIISFFSKTRLKKIEPDVLTILRIGLFQVIFMDRVPVSAAVDTSVELTKSFAPKWIVSYVNALLRNASEKYHDVSFPDPKKNRISHLATTKSFPEWLIKRWLKLLGQEETAQLCDAINTIPPITVRVNSLKAPRSNLLETLSKNVDTIIKTSFSPDGLSFTGPKILIEEFKEFKDGLFQVQDEAAQLVTQLLDPKPGEVVLDACAGLGGKTGHMAQMMNNQGSITAADLDEGKLLKLETDADRLGISIINTVKQDFNQPITEKPAPLFDRILLDAPCTGLGVLRRNPDTKWSALQNNLTRCKERQVLFMNNLADHVKPSGIMVYAVCSTEPEENGDVIKAFLNNHKEFVIEKKPGVLKGDANVLINNKGFLITSPSLHNMDGFFAARLKRIE